MKKPLLALFLGLVGSFAYGQDYHVVPSEVSVRDLLDTSKRVPKAETYYLMAMQAAKKNDFEEANKSIATGLKIDPRNIRILNLKAALLAKQGRLAEARTIFIAVLQISPKDEYANKSLEAIELSMQPKRNQLVQMIKTEAPNKKGDITKAPDASLSPVAEKPVDVKNKVLSAAYFEDLKHKQDCSHNMSLIQMAYEKYSARADKKKSSFSLTELVKDGVLVSAPVCPKGGEYSWSNKEVVCSVHKGFIALDSEVSSVFKEYNTGLRAKLSHNYLDALKAFEQVVILYPLWAEAHYQLSDTLFRLGEVDPALASLRTCLKHDPNNLDAQLLMANIYFKKGQKESALKLLDSISSKHKGSVYGLSARSVAKSIRSGRNYYEIFPPN